MLASALAGSRDHLAGSFPSARDSMTNVETQRERIESALNEHAAGRRWPGVIIDGRTGLVVGRVALQDIVMGNRRSCFISYWLTAAALGRGHATRAVAGILEVAFSQLRLHRVDAFVRPANTASLAVLSRCGFDRIGIAKRHTYVGGDWHDEVLLQKIAPWDAPGILEP